MDGNIESIDQLEILRVLGEQPTREWTPATLAGEVQATPPAIAAHVAALQARGLLTSVQQGGELVCQYGPHTPELQQLVSRLLQLYKERPVTLIRLVYARASGRLRAFADAFRLRKEN